MLLGSFIFIFLSREYITVLLCFRMPLESSSTSMPLSFPSPLPPVPDNISNSSPPPMSYITSQEMKCTLHWFASWLGSQCEPFQKDLVAKTVLGKNHSHCLKVWSKYWRYYLVPLSASCTFGINGSEVGLSNGTTNLSGSWRSVSQALWHNFTKLWLLQLKNARH